MEEIQAQKRPRRLLALAKRRVPFSAAKFGDDLANAYGVVWEDDLFAPADEDGRYTTNVDGFFGAQQEWLQNNLPECGTLLPQDEYGRPQLPKKAETVYGTPGKNDRIGHYLDPYSGAVKTVAYRLPETRKSGKTHTDPDDTPPDPAAPQPKTRPDVSQKGLAMIGDFRTDALHQALREARIEDSTLLALLVLALAAKNVSVQSGADIGAFEREGIAATITEGGVLTSDLELLRTAARNMLVAALSCRDNMSNSGPGGRIAGEAIGASLYLPTMATDEFLSCLSRQALEKAAKTEGVRAEVRVRDTRARFIERFGGTRYVYPAALFQLTAEEIAPAAPPDHLERWSGAITTAGLGGDAGSGGDTLSDTGVLAASDLVDRLRRIELGASRPALVRTDPDESRPETPSSERTTMIQRSSGGANLRVAPATPSSAPVPQRHLDRNILLHGIAARRRRLTELETSMVEACERAAVRGACRRVRMNDHDTWDKATWQRYLAAAARLEADYMPRMRRLQRDINRLERLLTLPMAPEPAQ